MAVGRCGKGINQSSKPKGIVTKFSGDNRKLKHGIRGKVAWGFSKFWCAIMRERK